MSTGSSLFGIGAALAVVGVLVILWRASVFWRRNRDLTQHTLCSLLIHWGDGSVGIDHGIRDTPEGSAGIIYSWIVDELHWDRVYAAKRLAHALTLVEAYGLSPAVNETARGIAKAVVDRLWTKD